MTPSAITLFWERLVSAATAACISTSAVLQSGYVTFTLAATDDRDFANLGAHFAATTQSVPRFRCYQFSDAALFQDAAAALGTTWFQKTIEGFRQIGLKGFLNEGLGLLEVFDPARGIAIRLLRSEDCLPPWEPSSPLANFVNWFNITQQAFMLHGATISDGRAGALIVAEGGTGKSLLTLACIDAGLITIGDDYSIVRMKGGQAEAARFSMQAKQSDTGLAMLGIGGRTRMAGERNFKDKYVFTIPTNPTPLAIHALIGLTRTDGVPVIAPERKPVLFTAISETTYQQLPASAFETQTFAGNLVRALPTFRFALGPDLKENAANLRAFLGGLHA